MHTSIRTRVCCYVLTDTVSTCLGSIKIALEHSIRKHEPAHGVDDFYRESTVQRRDCAGKFSYKIF
jgi:hypothetical protein